MNKCNKTTTQIADYRAYRHYSSYTYVILYGYIQKCCHNSSSTVIIVFVLLHNPSPLFLKPQGVQPAVPLHKLRLFQYCVCVFSESHASATGYVVVWLAVWLGVREVSLGWGVGVRAGRGSQTACRLYSCGGYMPS